MLVRDIVLICSQLTLTTMILNNKTDNLPALGSLSPSLLSSFLSLGAGARRLFLKLYRSIWLHLLPFSRLEVFCYVYALPSLLGSLSPAVSVHSFLVLSRLWFLSGGGACSVDSRALGLKSHEVKQASQLVKAGLISRSYFDPLHPHLVAYRSMQLVFISFTPAGIHFFTLVLKKLRNSAGDELLNYMRYQHKKGQTV
jgi:hypothetical protein